ncbi:cobalamin biosynthesis protein CbiX [Flavobacterium columnare NBRC 100251 = ATCC 23463]|uniref:sirohydrochlorin chelatase n=1 Tax=Flavobacterium columnare TaxID=996 RepID=UPI000BEA6F38|nr:sirohydrochlorin chelatase [Flavobacterium columnare]PDS23590.1 cobalamin biosynthesis protein CbiX [Flavobacterium columnare NBRC 100251 = ATCC 23463]GEM57951.1 sirohydrochlorin cobaltochelatase [Flavobacterium columnare NBRC 100251 = ATCC 23463]
MNAKKGILICGHGSRDPEGVTGFKELVRLLKLRYPNYEVDYGFLEFAHPIYAAAVERLYTNGVREIIAIPAILFAGSHAKNDIPYEMNTLQSQYPDLKIRLGKHFGITPSILQLSKKLIETVEAKLTTIERKETCLLVVGRGTADPDANSDIAKMTRMLWEGMGFGFATTTYIGVTQPLLKDTLPLVDTLPFKRVIVLPVFLFTGVLLKKIYNQIEEFAEKSNTEFCYTTSFECDELLLQTIDDRIIETEQGNPNMNCQLCKYRTQIIGFENEVGKEQIGHHLAVKGILFEEEEKIVTKKTILTSLKKILGI